ncbi:SBBP repeat-containing protein [Runella sp.]|uniref:SBBP repeat-containing protein n=1 Tax=Runella sp. TaxID=1960881 RepID=UPI003D13645D
MKYLCLIAFLFVWAVRLSAQNTTLSPTVFSPPKLTYDAILALPSPQIGDVAFDLTFNCLRVYVDGKWLCSYQDPANYTPNMLAIASAGGTSVEQGQSIAVDGSGNVYITGYFSGTAAFGSTSKTSAGGYDIFVAKYNNSGSLQWVQTAGGTGSDVGYGIAVDGSGNVYITGYFFGTATFGSTSKTSAGISDIFVAKYNTGGTLQWVQTAGGTSTELGYGIAVDGSGNVYITGNFQGTATFGSTLKTSAGGSDIFVAKYNTNGIFQWVQTAGGTNEDYGQKIDSDTNGNLYVTGFFNDTATFSRNTKTSAGSIDVYIVRIDK